MNKIISIERIPMCGGKLIKLIITRRNSSGIKYIEKRYTKP